MQQPLYTSSQNNQAYYQDNMITSNLNQDHLISNKNIQPIEMTSLRQTTELIQSKNQETINAIKAHQENMNLKKNKLKKYYEDYVNQVNIENQNLKV